MQSQNSDELKELRRAREKLGTLEVEHAGLQRRLKDQETKAAGADRTAQTARQSLAQAQQRAVEWEKRANEYDGELKLAQETLSKHEDGQRQLEQEHAVTKMQLEERDAEERLAKVR